MNILQLERIFEMQNEYSKHRIEIETQNKKGREWSHFNTEQIFEI